MYKCEAPVYQNHHHFHFHCRRYHRHHQQRKHHTPHCTSKHLRTRTCNHHHHRRLSSRAPQDPDHKCVHRYHMGVVSGSLTAFELELWSAKEWVLMSALSSVPLWVI